jgi:hypothetical protein
MSKDLDNNLIPPAPRDGGKYCCKLLAHNSAKTHRSFRTSIVAVQVVMNLPAG